MMEPNVCFFSMKLDFAIIFTEFSRRRFRYTIASFLEQKKFQCLLFFFGGNLVFGLGAHFAVSVTRKWRKKSTAFFCRISAGITASLWKIAAVNLNSQQKFYDNGASAAPRNLTTVSAELPAILEKYRRISKKIWPGIC